MRIKERGNAQLAPSRRFAAVASFAVATVALISCTSSGTELLAPETAEPTASVESTPEVELTTPASPDADTTRAVEAAEPAAEAGERYDAPGDLVVPVPLPAGLPGEVIATENLIVPSMSGEAPMAQRLLYHSRSVSGQDIAVSGVVVYPTGEAPEGGWPLIAWAHGTTGIGDGCAPSESGEDLWLASLFAAEGYAFVATDYEGLGTPGRHPYIVGESEAHSVLDSVRAVHNLGLTVTDEWIAFGYSQGGHAAMFTAQLQPSYAPELDLIGTIAGAPPSQTDALFESLIGGAYQTYIVMTAVGQAAAYPEIELNTILSPAVMDRLDVVDSACAAQIFASFGAWPFEDLVVSPDVFEVGVLADRLAAEDTNQMPTRQPLMIIHGSADQQIPVETSALLVDQLCDFDDQAPVKRNVYPGQPHGGAVWGEVAMPDVFEWIEARFAGEPAPDDCER